MVKDVWLNLPVKDVKKSQDFFVKIGFRLNDKFGDGKNSASLVVSERELIVMLFHESIFKGFTQNNLVMDAAQSEIIISFSTESQEEVDKMAERVRAAGGAIYAEPGWNQGWMYGFAFSDPDGHKWNMLYMDFSKLPK